MWQRYTVKVLKGNSQRFQEVCEMADYSVTTIDKVINSVVLSLIVCIALSWGDLRWEETESKIYLLENTKWRERSWHIHHDKLNCVSFADNRVITGWQLCDSLSLVFLLV